MKRVLLVDDDTIVRITLRSLIDWNHYGYEIVEDASNGEQAFKWLSENPVDLLITDMKMPIMDGLTLLGKLKENHLLPCTVVLSSYDDFGLVRESFRLGACDYLLKSDINEAALAGLLEKLLPRFSEDKQELHTEMQQEAPEKDKAEQLADILTGKSLPSEPMFDGNYYIIRFEIDDFAQQMVRFRANLKTELILPFLEFARQIPRVASRCIIGSLSPSHYAMLYQVSDAAQSRDNVVSTCKQLINVWNNFLNLSVSAGISSMGRGGQQLDTCFEEAGKQLELHCLTGKATMCYPWKAGQLPLDTVFRVETQYKELFYALHMLDNQEIEAERHNLFAKLELQGTAEAKRECLAVIVLVVRSLRELNYNVWDVFQEEVNYYQKLDRIADIRHLEVWMNNYLRWILEYQTNAMDSRQADLMVRARLFMLDNYSNPELTLGSVASYIGLNEKYFSTRFTKEMGKTFSNCLTEIRIQKAKELMDKTDLKVYEISQRAGYNNVEHFTRMFKKVCKVSPGAYKKQEVEKT